MNQNNILIDGENISYTENGAKSLLTTGSKCLDFYFKTVRKISQEDTINKLAEAWNEDPLSTLKIIFHIRDCRGGKGEREIFRWCCQWLAQNKKNHLLHNVKHIPNFGRWEDLLWLLDFDNDTSKIISNLIAEQLKSDINDMNSGKLISLCAKWVPTEGKKHDKKLDAVNKICKALKCNKKNYRKEYVTPLRQYLDIVEKLMCGKKWNEINYNKVPGIAMNKLKKAFEKNDPERFKEFKNKLQNKDSSVKVNASTVEPHQCVKQFMNNFEDDPIIEAQWEEIVKRVQKLGTFKDSIIISDVSGSMSGEPMQVSVALGILISSLTEGQFNNKIITFETNPKLHSVSGNNLREKVKNVMDMDWNGSTNFQAVFDLILTNAKFYNLTQEQMPKRLYVISDMQFDECDECDNGNNFLTNYEHIKLKYSEFGYKMPEIIFWNVRGNSQDFTNNQFDKGVAMISGFSPSILKAVINNDDFSPLGVLKNIINDDRLKCITLAQ